jgi:hypothetical protein
MRTLPEHRVNRGKLKAGRQGLLVRHGCSLRSLHLRRLQRVVKNGLGVGAASRTGRITRDTIAFQPQSPDPRQLELRAEAKSALPGQEVFADRVRG